MYCSNCGNELTGKFCSNCGAASTVDIVSDVTVADVVNQALRLSEEDRAVVVRILGGSIQQMPDVVGTYRSNLEQVEVREARLGYMAWFLLVWGLGFGGLPLAVSIIGRTLEPFLLVFIIPGMAAVGFFLFKVFCCAVVALCGTDGDGEVVGYDVMHSSSNGNPNLAALVETYWDGQRKVLFYELGTPRCVFTVGQRVKVRRYGDFVRVTKM